MPTSKLFRERAMRDLDYLKPEKFRHYFTMSECARAVGRDPSRLRKLEARGLLPKAHRVRAGQLEIRLWSPEQVEEIKEIFANLKPGRKPRG